MTTNSNTERLTKIMLHVAAHTRDAWARAYIVKRLEDLGYDATLNRPVQTWGGTQIECDVELVEIVLPAEDR